MWIAFRDVPKPSCLTLDGKQLDRVSKFKLLGVHCQNNLKWNYHIEEITAKVNKRLFFLRECRKARLPIEVGITMYCTRIRTLLEYAAPIWGGIPDYLDAEIERVQRRSLAIIVVSIDTLEKLSSRRDQATKTELLLILSNEQHPCQKLISINEAEPMYNLRSNRINKPKVPFSATNRHKQSFIPRAIRLLF